MQRRLGVVDGRAGRRADGGPVRVDEDDVVAGVQRGVGCGRDHGADFSGGPDTDEVLTVTRQRWGERPGGVSAYRIIRGACTTCRAGEASGRVITRGRQIFGCFIRSGRAASSTTEGVERDHSGKDSHERVDAGRHGRHTRRARALRRLRDLRRGGGSPAGRGRPRGRRLLPSARGPTAGDQPDEYLGMQLVHLPAVRHRVLETLSHTAVSMMHRSISEARRGHRLQRRPTPRSSPSCARTASRSPPTSTAWSGARSKWGKVGRRYYRAVEALAVRWSDALIADAAGIADYYRDRVRRADRADRLRGPDPHRPGPRPHRRARAGARGLPPRGRALRAGEPRPRDRPRLLASSAELPLVVVGLRPVRRRTTPPRSRPRRTTASGCSAAVWDQDQLDQLYANALSYVHGHSVGGTNPSLLRATGAGAYVDRLRLHLQPRGPERRRRLLLLARGAGGPAGGRASASPSRRSPSGRSPARPSAATTGTTSPAATRRCAPGSSPVPAPSAARAVVGSGPGTRRSPGSTRPVRPSPSARSATRSRPTSTDGPTRASDRRAPPSDRSAYASPSTTARQRSANSRSVKRAS